MTDGRQVDLFVSHAPGTPENPFTTDRVNGKARELMAPILGEARTDRLIEQVHSIEDVEDIRALRPLLTS